MPFESFTRPRPRGTVASAAVVALAAGVCAYVFTRRARRDPGAEQDVVQEESETVYVVAGDADGAPSADTRAARDAPSFGGQIRGCEDEDEFACCGREIVTGRYSAALPACFVVVPVTVMFLPIATYRRHDLARSRRTQPRVSSMTRVRPKRIAALVGRREQGGPGRLHGDRADPNTHFGSGHAGAVERRELLALVDGSGGSAGDRRRPPGSAGRDAGTRLHRGHQRSGQYRGQAGRTAGEARTAGTSGRAAGSDADIAVFPVWAFSGRICLRHRGRERPAGSCRAAARCRRHRRVLARAHRRPLPG